MTTTPMTEYAQTHYLTGIDGVFSAAQALYWYCVNNHEGQWSPEYRIQCQLSYSPGACETGPDEDSHAVMVTEALEAGELDPLDVFKWIEQEYHGADNV